MAFISPSLDAEALMRQAASTADYYLGRALAACKTSEIDPHPQIVAAFIAACASDYDTAVRARYAELQREDAVLQAREG